MEIDFNKYDICNKIDELYSNIKKTNNKDELKKLYQKVKKTEEIFYKENKISTTYELIKNRIRQSELIFNSEYEIDTKFKLLTEKEINTVLDKIVNETRKYILNKKHVNITHDKCFEIDLTNWCELASKKISELCDRLNIKCYTVLIHPGYSQEQMLFNGCGFHFFNIIKLKNEYYLLDATYSQFFKTSNCMIERIGIMDYPTPKPGAFIEEEPNYIKEILYKGYTKLDEDTLKNYLDLFTISFRNGLYYEQTRDYTFKTDYTIEDYINFLTKKDSQVKREGIEVLGFQKRPLKK